MSFTKEKKEKLIPIVRNFPEIEVGMDGVEARGEFSEEWVSTDEKRKIVVTVMGGGKEWEGVWLKDILLLMINPLLGSELMRVQFVKRPDSEELTRSVFVDVFKFEDEAATFESYGYSSDNDGEREEMGRVRLPGHLSQNITALDFLEELKDEDVFLLDEIPMRIDVDETIRLFVEQLQERNFVKPNLIPA